MDRMIAVLPIITIGCICSSSLIIEHALAKVPGVVYAYVNAATEMAYVIFTPGCCNLRDLERAIQKAGFTTNLSSTHCSAVPSSKRLWK